jgi:hypothetical protein
MFFLFENLCFGTLDFNYLIVQREQATQLVSEAICAGIFNGRVLFAYAEIWLMLMLMLKCCERKILFHW